MIEVHYKCLYFVIYIWTLGFFYFLAINSISPPEVFIFLNVKDLVTFKKLAISKLLWLTASTCSFTVSELKMSF